MTTPLSSPIYTEIRTAETPDPLRPNAGFRRAENSPQKTPAPLRTPLTDLPSLNGRAVKYLETKTPPTIIVDQFAAFTDVPLTDCFSAYSTTENLPILKTPPPRKSSRFPFPPTGLPSTSAKITSRPQRSYSPCRKLYFGLNATSTAENGNTPKNVDAVPVQVHQDPVFTDRANYFVKGIPPIEASLRAHRLIASSDSCLLENPNDMLALATKAVALIVRGEVADFVEVFHRTDPETMGKVMALNMQVLTKAESAFKLNQKNLIALVIKTGCLGLKGQHKQVMSTEASSSDPEDLDAHESSTLASLQSVHEETLASAEELLNLDPDHLTGVFMKIQALTFMGKTEKVLEMLNSAMKAHPDNAILWTLFARFYYEENPQKALEAMAKAIAIEPKQFLSHAIRLQLLGQMEDTEGFLQAKNDADKNLLPTHPLIQMIVKEFMPEDLK